MSEGNKEQQVPIREAIYEWSVTSPVGRLISPDSAIIISVLVITSGGVAAYTQKNTVPLYDSFLAAAGITGCFFGFDAYFRGIYSRNRNNGVKL